MKSDIQIIHGDCLQELPKIRSGSVDLVFADPPYNIGVDYGKGCSADKLPTYLYLRWCKKWMELCWNKLKPTGTFWVMINDEHADYFGIILRRLVFHRRSWIKWYETFGVNCTKKFNRTSRHIFHCVKDPKAYTFNADAIRVPSARLEKYNDTRANPKGKLPDDVWVIPRVAGTFKERIEGAKNQLPLELVDRIVACSSNPGDLVLDPFLGTGTSGVSATKSGRRFVGIDSSRKAVSIAKNRIDCLLLKRQK